MIFFSLIKSPLSTLLVILALSGFCLAQEQQQKWPCKDDPDLLRGENGKPIPVRQNELKKKLVWHVSPKSPPGCRCQGPVQVLILINTKGRIECLQFLSGHPLLKGPLSEALGKWRFDPYVIDGKVFSVTSVLTYNFTLDGNDWSLKEQSALPCALRTEVLKNKHERTIWLEPDEMVDRAIENAQPNRDAHFRGSGYVLVNVLVDRKGKIICAITINGHPLAKEAAMSAALKWTFKPMVTGSRPISFLGHLLFYFPYSDSDR
jgi:outer membrane biosynthesis protein TonB